MADYWRFFALAKEAGFVFSRSFDIPPEVREEKVDWVRRVGSEMLGLRVAILTYDDETHNIEASLRYAVPRPLPQ